MSRLLLVAALAPLFAALLAVMISTSIARRRPAGRAAVTAIAPVLYAATAGSFAIAACVVVGFDARQLGLWSSNPLVTPAIPAAAVVVIAVASAAGVVVAILGYLGELALADRSLRASPGPGSIATRVTPATQAVGWWARSPSGLLVLGASTAIAEELLFRGFLLTGLRQDLPLWAAMLIQAALFGIHHTSFGWRAIPIKFGHALVWASIAVAAGSLLPALVAHLVFQLLVCRRLVRRHASTVAVKGDRDELARGAAPV